MTDSCTVFVSDDDSGVYVPEGARKALQNDPTAMCLWMLAMKRDGRWVFRKSNLVKELNLSDYKWRKATATLRKLGLLKVNNVVDKVTRKRKGRTYEFMGWNSRLGTQSLGATKDVSQETCNDSNTNSNTLVFQRVEKPTPLFISRGGCRGDGGKRAEIREAKMDEFEALIHQKRFMDRFPGLNTFQTFDDSKRKSPRLARVIHNDMTGLQKLNDKGAGIFLTINETDGTGRRKENIVAVRAIFVDLDGSPVTPVLESDPHIVVESSPGKYHAYWFVRDFPMAAFKQTQQRLAEIFSGDKAVNDLPRVLRVPGFWHRKGEPFCTRIVFEQESEPLSYSEVIERFPPKPVPKWSAKSHKQDKNGTRRYKGEYGTAEGDRNNKLASFIGLLISLGYDQSELHDEAMHWGMCCTPPLPRGEIMSVVSSVGRYAR